MKHIQKIISIILLGLIIIACDSSKRTEEKETTEQIIVRINKGDQFFFGIGKVKGIRNHSLARITAGNRARAEIVETSKTYLTRLIEDFAAHENKKLNINPLIQSLSRAAMSDIGIVTNKYIPHRRTWYSLARLDLADFLENIKGLKKIDPAILKYIQENAAPIYTELEPKNQNQKNRIRKIFGKDIKQLSSSLDRHPEARIIGWADI